MFKNCETYVFRQTSKGDALQCRALKVYTTCATALGLHKLNYTQGHVYHTKPLNVLHTNACMAFFLSDAANQCKD